MRRILLPALLSLGLFAGCKQDAPPAPTAPPSPEPSMAAGSKPAKAPVPLGATGTVKGTVTYAGEVPAAKQLDTALDPSCSEPLTDEVVLASGGKLANVMVRLKGELPEVPVPSEPAVMDQVGCAYRPRVLGAVSGQTLQVRNSDGTLHNVHSYAGARTLFNRAQPPGARAMDTTFPSGTEVVRLKCDVHPWMLGWVVVAQHPWFAVSGTDGSFTIEGAPVGTWEIEAWHESLGTKSGTATITENGTAEVTFAY